MIYNWMHLRKNLHKSGFNKKIKVKINFESQKL